VGSPERATASWSEASLPGWTSLAMTFPFHGLLLELLLLMLVFVMSSFESTFCFVKVVVAAASSSAAQGATISKACIVLLPGLAHKSNTLDPGPTAPTAERQRTGSMEPSSCRANVPFMLWVTKKSLSWGETLDRLDLESLEFGNDW